MRHRATRSLQPRPGGAARGVAKRIDRGAVTDGSRGLKRARARNTPGTPTTATTPAGVAAPPILHAHPSATLPGPVFGTAFDWGKPSSQAPQATPGYICHPFGIRLLVVRPTRCFEIRLSPSSYRYRKFIVE